MALRTIIVDDSAAARHLIKKTLADMQCEFLFAADGEEALKVLQDHSDTELALVDWNMPVMNGLELVTALRKDSRFDNMRIIMVTTETEMMQVVRAIEAGANEYVMKPFTKEIILDKLKLVGISPE